MKHLVSLLSGLFFGFGLILTGMYSPDIVIAGLKIGASTFKYNLLITFIIALFVTSIFFQLKRKLTKPLMSNCYELPTNTTINWRLIVGAIFFGIGWGMTGICPGPNIVGLGLFGFDFYWINFIGMIIGFFIGAKLIKRP